MIDPMRMLAALAEEFDTPVDVLIGYDRTKRISAMRSVAMAVVREQCGCSYPEVARIFRRIDHTTALMAHRRALKLLRESPDLAVDADRAIRRMRDKHADP